MVKRTGNNMEGVIEEGGKDSETSAKQKHRELLGRRNTTSMTDPEDVMRADQNSLSNQCVNIAPPFTRSPLVQQVQKTTFYFYFALK